MFRQLFKNAVAAFTPSPPHFLLEQLCLSAFQNEGVEEQPPHYPLSKVTCRSDLPHQNPINICLLRSGVHEGVHEGG